VIKLTTPFVHSYMIMRVSLVSRAVPSASGASVKSVNETRFALKDITMAENKTVFAVKKNFRTRKRCRMCSLTKDGLTKG